MRAVNRVDELRHRIQSLVNAYQMIHAYCVHQESHSPAAKPAPHLTDEEIEVLEDIVSLIRGLIERRRPDHTSSGNQES
jgi:hypothetical protein